MNINAKNRATDQPIIWEGDFKDDCTSVWAGLMLRAECMKEDIWWWSVYDLKNNHIQIDCSDKHPGKTHSGEAARKEAEMAAKAYLFIKE